MTDVVAVVPARGGSKGVPRKNLRPLGRKPLVAHQLETALAAETVDRTILSTDDEEIAAVGRDVGAEVPFIRPSELATDEVPVIAAVKHCAKFLLEDGVVPAYVVCLQPTSPFTTINQLDEAVSKALSTACDSVVSVAPVTETHPYRAYRLDGDQVYPIPGLTETEPLQRQDRPNVYGFTGAIYVRRLEVLLAWEYDDFALGQDIRAVVQHERSSVEIDTEFDLEVARALLNYEEASENI